MGQSQQSSPSLIEVRFQRGLFLPELELARDELRAGRLPTWNAHARGGAPLDPLTDTPQAWRDHIRTTLGRHAPHRLTDGRTPAWRDWTHGYDPDTWLDRAIFATRQEIFPLHGLDPMP